MQKEQNLPGVQGLQLGEGLPSSPPQLPQAEQSGPKACCPESLWGQAGKGSGWVVEEDDHDE